MQFDLGSAAVGAVGGFCLAAALAFALMRVQHENFAKGQSDIIESAYSLRRMGTDEERVWEILREYARESRKR